MFRIASYGKLQKKNCAAWWSCVELWAPAKRCILGRVVQAKLHFLEQEMQKGQIDSEELEGGNFFPILLRGFRIDLNIH